MEPAKDTLFQKKAARSAVRAVRDLFDIIDASGMSYTEIGGKAGVHAVTMSYWRSGKNTPNLFIFEAMAEALGYRIELVPIEPVSKASSKDA